MPKRFTPVPESIEEIVLILRRGGVVVFPTDTAYGLGVDATNPQAIEKVYDIKGRPQDMPLSIAVATLEDIDRYAVLDDTGRRIARAFLPGPLTLVLSSRRVLSANHAKGKDTIGVRIPDHRWLSSLLHSFGHPLTATSANKSGSGACYSIAAIRESLGEAWSKIDAFIDAGELPSHSVSTVLDCTQEPPKILREGPISGTDIKRVLL